MTATRRDLLRGAGALAALSACGTTRLAGPFEPAPRCAGGACTTVDVHCHVFNASDLPVAAFVSSVAPVPERLVRRLATAFERILNRTAPAADLELAALASRFGGPVIVGTTRPAAGVADAIFGSISLPAGSRGASTVAAIRRLVELLDHVLQNRAEIAGAMVAAYPSVDLFTPCLVDFDGWAKGQTRSPLADQIRVQERVAKLSIRGKIGHASARVHPFVAFNPLREVARKIRGKPDYRPYGDVRVFTEGVRYACNAPLAPPAGPWQARTAAPPVDGGGIELVRHAIEVAGFTGVKLYPPVGFVPIGNASFHPEPTLGRDLDRAMRAFFAYAEAEQVPITAHSANSNGYRLGYGDLASPDGWSAVLKEFPALRLNLGHFGHLAGADETRGVRACEAWMRKTAALMQHYPNVYADISYSEIPIEDGYAATYLDHLETIFDRFPRAKFRVMYGSDWWLNRLSPNADAHVDACHQVFQERFGDTVRRDVMGENALRFLGFLDDGRRRTDTRARRRLRAFYADEPVPPWLATSG